MLRQNRGRKPDERVRLKHWANLLIAGTLGDPDAYGKLQQDLEFKYHLKEAIRKSFEIYHWRDSPFLGQSIDEIAEECLTQLFIEVGKLRKKDELLRTEELLWAVPNQQVVEFFRRRDRKHDSNRIAGHLDEVLRNEDTPGGDPLIEAKLRLIAPEEGPDLEKVLDDLTASVAQELSDDELSALQERLKRPLSAARVNLGQQKPINRRTIRTLLGFLRSREGGAFGEEIAALRIRFITALQRYPASIRLGLEPILRPPTATEHRVEGAA